MVKVIAINSHHYDCRFIVCQLAPVELMLYINQSGVLQRDVYDIYNDVYVRCIEFDDGVIVPFYDDEVVFE